MGEWDSLAGLVLGRLGTGVSLPISYLIDGNRTWEGRERDGARETGEREQRKTKPLRAAIHMSHKVTQSTSAGFCVYTTLWRKHPEWSKPAKCLSFSFFKTNHCF